MNEVTITRDFGPTEYVMTEAHAFKASLIAWVEENSKANATMPLVEFRHTGKTARGKFTLAFERQEDAALFKLFWC